MALNMITGCGYHGKAGQGVQQFNDRSAPGQWSGNEKRLLHIPAAGIRCTKEGRSIDGGRDGVRYCFVLLMAKKSIGLEQAIKVFEECGEILNQDIGGIEYSK